MSDYNKTPSLLSSFGLSVLSFLSSLQHWARKRRQALYLLGRFFESMYESTLVTYGGAPEFDEQHRLATRFLNIGFGIFLLIVLRANISL